jgi:hypothetical protein
MNLMSQGTSFKSMHTESVLALGREPVTMAEQELAEFISFAKTLLGSEPAECLTNIWLDELASMETMPGPTSLDWRLVTVGATARLATRLIVSGYSKSSS